MKASPSPGLRKDHRPQLTIAAAPTRSEPRTTLADVAAAILLAIGAAFERRRGRERRAGNAVITAVPIVLVNIVAFYGQYDYLTHNLSAPRAITTIMAAALESIAIYLAYQAHIALIADDSALRLRLGAYSVALLIAVLNYSHWMRPHWRPTATAVAFALCSAISPALWSVHSRRSNRAGLKARGLIEDHAVRLGATRWFWHVAKSVQVMFAATWIGENRPDRAIALYRSRLQRKEARKSRDRDLHRDKPAQGRTRRVQAAKARPELPPADTRTPPPVTGPREPRGDLPPASRAKARGTGPAAARTPVEADMIRELIESAAPLPAARALAEDPRLTGSLSTRRRAAGRVLTGAAAGMNGNG